MADQTYFIEKNIEHLFEGLMEALVTAKPDNPRQFLAAQLQDNTLISFQDFLALFSAISRISSETDPKRAYRIIIEETCKILKCERASLFIHDPAQKCLKLIVGKGAKSLVLYENSGFTWNVFKTKTIINIPDVYSDPRFDCSVDMTTGFVSKSLLGVPVINGNGDSIGVLLALNKTTGNFGEKDEEILKKIAQQAGISIRNAIFFEKSVYNENKAKVLLHFIKNLNKDLPGQPLALDLATHAADLIGADRCHVFIINRSVEKLLLIAADSEIDFKLPLSAGLTSHVATTGETLNLLNAYEDPRYISDYDEIFHYKTQSFLAIPIKCDNEIIGVIQASNKHFKNVFGDIEIYDTFTSEDEELLMVFSEIIGKRLKNSFNSLLSENAVTVDKPYIESSFGKKRNSISEENPMGIIKEEFD